MSVFRSRQQVSEPHSYYWAFLKSFGSECYRTWRWELASSVVVGFFFAVLTGGWKDFRTALLATGLALAVFAVWHLLRTPWLLHKDLSIYEHSDRPGTLSGLFGITVLIGIFAGAYELGVSLWAMRTDETIPIAVRTPPPPTIHIDLPNTAKPQCLLRNYTVPSIPSPPAWGLVTILCNTTIRPPYSVEVDYDQDVAVGPFTFPVGSEFTKSMESNQGRKVVAMFDLHTIIPNEPFSIMAKSTTDNAPMATAGVIRSKGLVLQLHP